CPAAIAADHRGGGEGGDEGLTRPPDKDQFGTAGEILSGGFRLSGSEPPASHNLSDCLNPSLTRKQTA
ncbi:hypothetical protein, partial [Bradyrhizobium sp. STM 3809]|uniref:hypothetical protein n=1 Tax=Bradyrhizobium sp. STM 3809 TaxID=551936 RepID=UPI001AEC1947